jgi:hypothetical protein
MANAALLGAIMISHFLFFIFAGDGYLEWTSSYQDVSSNDSAPPIALYICLLCSGCAIFVWLLNIFFYFGYSKRNAEFQISVFWRQLGVNILILFIITGLFLLAGSSLFPKFIEPYNQIMLVSDSKIWVQYGFSFLIIVLTCFLQLCIMPPDDARSAPIWKNSQFSGRKKS